MKKAIQTGLILMLLLSWQNYAMAQEMKQTIRGTVIDIESKMPLMAATFGLTRTRRC